PIPDGNGPLVLTQGHNHRFVEKFEREVGLPQIRATPELAQMVLVNRSRLSVQPVTEAEFEHIVAMAGNRS
ncbi:MAG: EVE domain-containing protein, partial [Gemmatimonadota bacterium]|nr:EVE domain-containing protein [Gemmatimonadota bacterium]